MDWGMGFTLDIRPCFIIKKPIFDLENWKIVLNAIIIYLIYNYKCIFSATGFTTKLSAQGEKYAEMLL